MQKAIRTTLFFVCLFTVLITSSASANDGKGGNHGAPAQPVPGIVHKGLHSADVDAKSGPEKGWLGNLGDQIGDFFSQLFGHHHHPSPGNHPGGESAPAPAAPGGSSAPGSPSVPFDGGIGLLLAAGLGLGLKMARDRYRTAAVRA
jgi:hypothetical protein